MKWILFSLCFLSLIFGLLTGRIDAVSRAVIEQSASAVTLLFTLMGSICFWSGLMEIAERSKLTDRIAILFRPLTKLLFPGLRSSAARCAICMSITANLLGLGNAATPLGLTVMKHLAAENHHSLIASDHMITFVVMNTCSIQLIPSTIAALRLAAGSRAPMEILPAILIVSGISLAVALLLTRLCGNIFPIIRKHSGDKA